MFRHCVMFEWSDQADDAAKAAVVAGLDELAKLDVVAAYSHGPDEGLNVTNFDYVLVGDFASQADYQVYATDAGHLQFVADVLRPNIKARAAVQFEF